MEFPISKKEKIHECNFHPCCSLNIPSVFQVQNSSCPIDTDLAQASPWGLGGWARQCHSLVVAALWAEQLGVAALGRLRVDNSSGSGKGVAARPFAWRWDWSGEGACANHKFCMYRFMYIYICIYREREILYIFTLCTVCIHI